MHPVHHPGPKPFQIINQKGERKGCDRFLVNAILRQPSGKRRTDHGIGKARRYTEKERGQWRSFSVGPHAFRQNHARWEEHTSELESLMRHSYAVVCLTK